MDVLFPFAGLDSHSLPYSGQVEHLHQFKKGTEFSLAILVTQLASSIDPRFRYKCWPYQRDIGFFGSGKNVQLCHICGCLLWLVRHMGPLQVMVLPMEVISGPIWHSALKIYFCNVEPKKDRVLFLQEK